MSLIDRACNRFLVSPFLVNSLPKSGTHLLCKAVRLFPGIASRESLHLGHSSPASLEEGDESTAIEVPVGVDWPREVPLKAVQRDLRSLKRGHFSTGHLPFSWDLAGLLSKLEMKMLIILRDPRDVVVSHARYVANSSNHFLHRYYSGLPESEQITISIIGIRQAGSQAPQLLNIHDRCRSLLPWIEQDFTYLTYFERLVGPPGGGTRNAQLAELENIAHHLGIRSSEKQLEEIAEELFGGTSTFRKGVIGSWKLAFSAEHRRVFKEVAGQTLVDLGYEESCSW